MKERIKHHQMPGDISRREKIRLREKDRTPRGKSFRRELRMRQRAVSAHRLRERLVRDDW